MTHETARTVANTVLATAALVGAVVIVRTPRLRRLVVGVAGTALSTTLPGYLLNEIRKAWVESARAA